LRKNRNLIRWFRYYNKTFFGGRLKEPEVIQYKLLEKYDGILEWEPLSLYIDSGLRRYEKVTKITILHEMAHLENGEDYVPEHGMRWNATMDRLYMAGAYEGLL
jgi:hypothetical protein